MHAFHVRVVGLGLVATVLHIRPVRAAEPSAADRDTSRSLYAQGMEALDKHDYASAERACGGAYALVKVSTAARASES
jgi:phosphohistidine phosphatase SixA